MAHYDRNLEVPADLSGCLEHFADSLEADMFSERLTLTAAATLAVSLNELSGLLDNFANRGTESVSQSNNTAQRFQARLINVAFPGDPEVTKAVTAQSLQRPDDYFQAINNLAALLKTTAAELLNQPSRESVNSSLEKLVNELKNPVLEKDELLFNLSFTGPLNAFIQSIDFADNRDTKCLRASSQKTIVENFPTSAAELFRAINDGPLKAQAIEIAEALEAKAA